MTMPHLMNCSHAESGWCLECVKELQAKLDDFTSDPGGYLAVGGFVSRIHELEELLRRALGFVAMRLDGRGGDIDVKELEQLERDLRAAL